MREALGCPEPVQMIDCDGTAIAVHREGAGPPVVCLHAVGHGGRDFDAFAAAIRGRFEVIRIDWPGQGRSGPDRVPASAERYAEILALVLARLGVERPLLVGNSIGGAAAIRYAAGHPVRGLVLCDSGGLVRVGLLVRAFTGAFARFFAAGERGAPWFPRAFAFYYGRVVLPAAAAREQRERIVAAGPEVAGVLRQAWSSFGRAEADLRAVAAALDVPVWCAWARGDRVIPLFLCRPALRRLKRARIDTFPGGHAPFLEAPEDFARRFLRFAEGLQPSSPPSPGSSASVAGMA